MSHNLSLKWLLIERAAEAFESARAADPDADPTRFCPPVHHPDRMAVLRELLRVGLEFDWNEGNSRHLEIYLDRFPEVRDDPETVRQLAFEEYRLRRARGEHPSPKEYAHRYGVDVANWPVEGEGTLGHPTVIGIDHILKPVAELPDRYPEPGEDFLGFRIANELGRGAFARVYLGFQEELAGRPVALKVSINGEGESQTLARLQHTNIVPIYSHHRGGKYHAVCMPYFGSTTLEDVLCPMRETRIVPGTGEGFVSTLRHRRASTVAPIEGLRHDSATEPATLAVANQLQELAEMSHVEATLRLGIDMADGLAHAHDRGVIHGDLKPANVLLADDGRPMLLDFNLAQIADEAQHGPTGGTPFYMAPEHLDRLLGNPVAIDRRIDVYAFGLILFELLTGQPPVPSPDAPFRERLILLRQARLKLPPSARAWNASVSPSLDSIVRKCLEPNPANRYPSAHELREDLHRQLNHQPLLHVQEPSRKERLAKFARRHPWVKSLPFVAGVTLLALALSTGAIWYGIQQSRVALAETTLRDHRRDFAALRPTLTLPEPDLARVEKTRELVRVALDRYRVGEPDWENTVPVRYLSWEDRERLRSEIAELLLLSSSWERTDPTRAVQLARQARDLAPTEGLRWQAGEEIARRFESRGETDYARSAREENGPPPDATGWKYLVAESHARRQYAKSRRILDGVDAASRREPDYWYAVGRTHAALGDHLRAVDAFETAMVLQIEDPLLILNHRARSYFALKDYSHARADYDELIRRDPEEGRYYLDRALVLLAGKDHVGALANLERAEILLPRHTRIHFVREQVFQLAGQRQKAAESRRRGLEAEPEDAISWVARGVARLAKDPRGALDDFDAALEIEPTHRDALQNKAAVLADQLGDNEGAVRVLDALVMADPDYVTARAGRAVYLARLGRRPEAHVDAEEVLRRSEEPFYRYQMAGVFALTSRKNPEDARRGLSLLREAFLANTGLEYVDSDPDLRPLEGLAEFRRLLDAAKVLKGPTRR